MLQYLKALFAFLDPAIRAQKEISHATREAAAVERCLEKGIDQLLSEKIRLLKKASALPKREREDFRETMDAHFTCLANQMKDRFSPLNRVFEALATASKAPDLNSASYIRSQISQQQAIASSLSQNAINTVGELQLTLDQCLCAQQTHGALDTSAA